VRRCPLEWEDGMSVRSDNQDVHEATDDEMREGVKRALDRLDLTYAQLERQAREGQFSSEEARLVWFAISPRDGAVC
jgi:hypothetical protein